MVTRFVITHVGINGLRCLTFAQQARNTYQSLAEAREALDTFRGPNGLQRVFTTEEMDTLAVCEVPCYDHGDPIRYYVDDDCIR